MQTPVRKNAALLGVWDTLAATHRTVYISMEMILLESEAIFEFKTKH